MRQEGGAPSGRSRKRPRSPWSGRWARALRRPAGGIAQALEDAALLLGSPMGPLLLTTLPAAAGARGESTGEKLLTVARVADAGFSDAEACWPASAPRWSRSVPSSTGTSCTRRADVNPAQPHPILRAPEGNDPVGLRPSLGETDEHRPVRLASSTYPGFGLEGQILAGGRAAGQALALSGRKTVSAT